MTEKMSTFLASYRHEGAEWSLEFQARDWQDAEARLTAMQWAKLDGKLKAKVPASLGWFARAYVALRNLARGGR